MLLNELVPFIENDTDKWIMSGMMHETEGVLNKRLGDMICTCVDAYQLNKDNKTKIRNTLMLFNRDSFGAVGTLLNLILYLGVKFKHHNNVGDIANGFISVMLQYFTKEIGKAEFVQQVWRLQEGVGISDKFYDGLVDYFGSHKDSIINPILQRI